MTAKTLKAPRTKATGGDSAAIELLALQCEEQADRIGSIAEYLSRGTGAMPTTPRA